ncbi:hypothetical protein BKA61DRAFT_704301 [Leptodontidium sp. MPI-SDFR-AT-0119]|nr:hypothetical protein BKA61DRAFT_704301 [Leptodontidium sp. MPI-SDFR-AT-0119]
MDGIPDRSRIELKPVSYMSVSHNNDHVTHNTRLGLSQNQTIIEPSTTAVGNSTQSRPKFRSAALAAFGAMLAQNENDNMKPGIVRTPKSWQEFRAINSHDDSFYTYSPARWCIVPLPTFPSGKVDNSRMKARAILISWPKLFDHYLPTPPRQFPQFSGLPLELQIQIYEAALPKPRLVEVSIDHNAEVNFTSTPLNTALFYLNNVSKEVALKNYKALDVVDNVPTGLTASHLARNGVYSDPTAIDAMRDTILMDIFTLENLDHHRYQPFDASMGLDTTSIRNIAISTGDRFFNNDPQNTIDIMIWTRYIKANCPHLKELRFVVGCVGTATPDSILRLTDFGDHLEDLIFARIPYFLQFARPASVLPYSLSHMTAKLNTFKQHYITQIAQAPASEGWANIDFNFSILSRQTRVLDRLPRDRKKHFEKTFIVPKIKLPYEDVTFYTMRPAYRRTTFELEFLGTSAKCYADGELMHWYDGIKEMFAERE